MVGVGHGSNFFKFFLASSLGPEVRNVVEFELIKLFSVVYSI